MSYPDTWPQSAAIASLNQAGGTHWVMDFFSNHYSHRWWFLSKILKVYLQLILCLLKI